MVDFLLIGPESIIGYKDIFPLIKEKRIRLGYKRDRGHMFFTYSSGDLVDVRSIRWFQNLDYVDVEKIILSKKYVEGEYKKFDNTDFINIDDYRDIPQDYDGVMGVPITFIRKWNTEQFDVIGIMKEDCIIEGDYKFTRILIKKK